MSDLPFDPVGTEISLKCKASIPLAVCDTTHFNASVHADRSSPFKVTINTLTKSKYFPLGLDDSTVIAQIF
jgi:hypothetical protein